MKIGILLALLFVSAMMALSKNGEDEKAREIIASDFKANILKDIGGAKPHWTEVEFEHNSDSDFNFIITYKKNSQASSLAKNETEQLVRASLKRLMAEGRKPTDDLTFINVTALQEAGKGETGESLVVNLGTARYNMNNDQIDFEMP